MIDALVTAQEKERSDIAYELHGNIAQILVSALLYLGLSRPALKTTSPFFEETELLINDALKEIRNLSNFLSPPYLKDTPLEESFDNIRRMMDNTIVFHNCCDGFNEAGVQDNLKLTLYRIVEEWCRGINKKPGVNNIYLTLSGNNKKMVLRIQDDGIISQDPVNVNPILLTGIAARTSLFNGETKFTTKAGKGSELTVVFGK
jgi:two-component system NarL family sensor kinase